MARGKTKGRPKGSRSGYTVTSKAIQQRRNNSALIPAQTDEERDYNSRQIAHVMKVQEIAQSAIRGDLVSLKSCFYNYLCLCQEDGFKISNLGAYAAMGMDSHSFSTFSRSQDPQIREFCRMVKTTCAISRETLVADSKLNPVIGIFWQRNFDGLRNDTEQVQSAQETEDNYLQNQSYKDKYLNMVDED